MDKTAVRLIVYFEEPFWTGVFERTEQGRLSVCRVVFGAEPKDYDVLAYILEHYSALRFSPAVSAEIKEQKLNPKRMQREAGRQMLASGIGTKSQQALKLQREQNKLERRIRTRETRQSEQRRLFEQKQQKKKEKHRGR